MRKSYSEIITALCCNTSQDYLGHRIQIAAQCLADSAESPLAEAESVLLRELLRIRSKGKIVETQAKINSFGKKYLLDFASNPKFYKYVLATRLKDVTEQDGAITFAKELLELSKSPDISIQYAAIEVFLDLVHKFDITAYVTENIIDGMVKQVGVSTLLVDILGLLNKVETPLSENLLATISDTCVKLLCDEILDYYKGSLKNDLAFCHLLELVSKNSLINDAAEVNKHIAKSLQKILKDLPPYRSNSSPFKVPLRNYISCLIRFMISIDKAETENKHVKMQLLEMLQKGDSKQRMWSILIVGKVFHSDKDVIKAVYGALSSPNKIVRLSAISTLRYLDLDANDMVRIQEKYQEAIATKNKVEKFWSLVKETILGLGALGSTEDSARFFL